MVRCQRLYKFIRLKFPNFRFQSYFLKLLLLLLYFLYLIRLHICNLSRCLIKVLRNEIFIIFIFKQFIFTCFPRNFELVIIYLCKCLHQSQIIVTLSFFIFDKSIASQIKFRSVINICC